jgi:integral membrane sensor domain MASE1
VGGGLVSSGPTSRIITIGILLVLASVALLQVSSGYPYFELTISTYTFHGVLYLGVPFLLYRALQRQRLFTPLPTRTLTALFAAGVLAAIACLILGTRGRRRRSSWWAWARSSRLRQTR